MQEAYRKCSGGEGYLPWIVERGYLPWTGGSTYLGWEEGYLHWTRGRSTYLGWGRGTYLVVPLLHLDLAREVPTLDRGRGTDLGVPPILTWPGGWGTYLGPEGYLPWGTTPSTLAREGEEYLPWTGEGYLPWGTSILTWMGGTSIPSFGQGVPTLGYSLPPPGCGQTDTCENSTFPSYYVRGR